MGVGTGIFTFVMLGIVSAIPIAMICLGALHMDECPMQPWIPIFMVVAGAVGLVMILLTMCTMGFNVKGWTGMVIAMAVIIGLLVLFAFGWNIAGSIWVFKKWSNWDKVKNTDQGCYTDMYLFAFAYLIIFWISCPCQAGKAHNERNDDV